MYNNGLNNVKKTEITVLEFTFRLNKNYKHPIISIKTNYCSAVPSRKLSKQTAYHAAT